MAAVFIIIHIYISNFPHNFHIADEILAKPIDDGKSYQIGLPENKNIYKTMK